MTITIESLTKRNAALKRAGVKPRRLVRPLGNKLAADGPSAGLIGTDDKLMVASFVISTSQRDRGGDEVNTLGIKLENYAKNPIVLFGHGLQIPWPIGQSREALGSPIWVFPEAERCWAKCRFSTSCPEGKQFYGMVKEGVLNCASIGFDAKRAVRLKPLNDSPDAIEQAGFGLIEIDLLEWSIVPVPMCQGAIRLNSWQADRIASIISRGRYEGELVKAPMIKALLPYAAKPSGFVPSGFDSSKRGKTMDDPNAKPAGDLQCVKCMKTKFPNETDAVKYCESKSYKTDAPEHDDKSFNYHQFPASELEGDGKEQDSGDEGVMHVVGKRKDTAPEISNPGDKPSGDEIKDIDAETDQPRKAGDVWIETLTGHLNAVLDMLADTESTQERSDILESSPVIEEMLADIAEVVSELEAAGKKKKEESPDKKPEDDKPGEKATRLLAMWAKAKNGGMALAAVDDILDFAKSIYNKNGRLINRTEMAEMQKRYLALKKAIAEPKPSGELGGIDVGKLMAEAIGPLSSKLDEFGKRTAALVGSAD